MHWIQGEFWARLLRALLVYCKEGVLAAGLLLHPLVFRSATSFDSAFELSWVLALLIFHALPEENIFRRLYM